MKAAPGATCAPAATVISVIAAAAAISITRFGGPFHAIAIATAVAVSAAPSSDDYGGIIVFRDKGPPSATDIVHGTILTSLADKDFEYGAFGEFEVTLNFSATPSSSIAVCTTLGANGGDSVRSGDGDFPDLNPVCDSDLCIETRVAEIGRITFRLVGPCRSFFSTRRKHHVHDLVRLAGVIAVIIKDLITVVTDFALFNNVVATAGGDDLGATA